jgi:hypothetical protein
MSIAAQNPQMLMCVMFNRNTFITVSTSQIKENRAKIHQNILSFAGFTYF